MPGRAWVRAPALSTGILEDLRGVNEACLRLLARDRPDLLPAADLDAAAIATLSRCPFSLFNACFEDGEFWAAQADEPAIRGREANRDSASSSQAAASAFADLALFYSWHLAHSNRLGARILLGMAEPTLSAFTRLSLSRIQELACAEPELVSLRWRQRGPFWENLLKAARSGASELLEDVGILGIQMIAFDLRCRPAARPATAYRRRVSRSASLEPFFQPATIKE